METKRIYGFAGVVAAFVCAAAWMLCLSACDEGGSSRRSGTLRMSLAADTTSLKKGISSGVTRAVADELAPFLTTDDYRVLILSGKDTTRSYERFDRMPSEIELTEGAYTIVASKGNNLPVAFDSPYFEGSTDFTIKEGMNTPIEVTASLGNARITAEYTDDFKEAYTEYTVLLSSSYTSSELEIAKGETRPAYMQAGKDGTEIAIGIKLKKATWTAEKTYYVPTTLKIERRQNLRLIFKTNGEAIEGIGLDVVLDDTMEEMTMTTEIPDFMWQQVTKPTLSAVGFSSGDSKEIKTSTFSDNLQIGFNVPGGMKSLTVKRWMDGEEEAVAEADADVETETIDIVSQKDEALSEGYSWMVGETENGSLQNVRAGYVSLLNAIRSLPADPDKEVTYHFVFHAVDATGKAYESNAIRLTVVVQPAEAPFIDEAKLALPSEVVEGDELTTMLQTTLTAEGLVDEENTSLTLTSTDGLSEKFVVTSSDDIEELYNKYGITIEKESASRLNLYVFKPFTSFLTAPTDGGSTTYTLSLHLQDKAGKTDEVTKTIIVNAPKFEFATCEGNAFAKRIILRTNFLGNEDKDKLTYQYLVGSTWTDVPNRSLKKSGSSQWVDTLRSLTPETEYSVRAVYNKGKTYERRSSEVKLQTEAERYLPENDAKLNNWSHKEVYKKTIWSVGTTGLGIEEWWPYAEGSSSWWATRNALTTSQRSGTSCYYTSYSGTIGVEGYEGQAAEISSVGWGEGNTYTEVGGKIKNKTAGMLFIGSHSATSDGNETINYGHDFNVRPTAFEFYYKFKPVNGESFKAYIVLENRENGTVELGRGEFTSNKSVDSFGDSPARVNIQYSNYLLKATHMYIVFVSSTESTPTVNRVDGSLNAFSGYSDSRYVGNVLTVDDVNLIYE